MSEPEAAGLELRDEQASLEATLLPDAGMLCCSLRHRGEELLAQNAGVAAYSERGKTMGIPLLYPWANRLAGFHYTVAERSVSVPRDGTLVALDDNGLPIHGLIGGRLKWELERAPAPERPSLLTRLSFDRSKPELFEVFPFEHELRFEARLARERLELAVTVHACGADVVPVAFGFHPYLAPPGSPREGWLIELPPMRHLRLDARQIPIAPDESLPGRHLELAGQQFDDGFDAVGEPARFSVDAGERRIALEFMEGYPCAQVFAPRASQFICFEPMTAPANALLSKTGLRLLAPGERYRATFAVSVEDLPARP